MKRGELVGKADIIGRIGDVDNSPPVTGGTAKCNVTKPKAVPVVVLPKVDATAKKTNDKKANKAAVAKLEPTTVKKEADPEPVPAAAVSRPMCPFENYCFNTSLDHFSTFSHGADFDASPLVLGPEVKSELGVAEPAPAKAKAAKKAAPKPKAAKKAAPVATAKAKSKPAAKKAKVQVIEATPEVTTPLATKPRPKATARPKAKAAKKAKPVATVKATHKAAAAKAKPTPKAAAKKREGK